jgi:hypothetical protein
MDAMGAERAPIFVDVVGIGASVYDQLKVKPGLQVTPVNNGSKANGTDSSGKYEFANVRAASYWKLREALDPTSGEDIALPDTRDVRTDLTAPRYAIVGGRIKIEAKDDIKSRIGRSPDDGDALALAWHGVSLPRMGKAVYF